MSSSILLTNLTRCLRLCTRSGVVPIRHTVLVNTTQPRPVLHQTLPYLRTLHTSSYLQYDQTLYENNLYDGLTKYYIDLKKGDDGNYVKISEKSRGKRATMMVDIQYLTMFTSKLMVAGSGEEVGTLQAGKKSYDFRMENKANGSTLVVTENSGKKFNVFISCETIPELIKILSHIIENFDNHE